MAGDGDLGPAQDGDIGQAQDGDSTRPEDSEPQLHLQRHQEKWLRPGARPEVVEANGLVFIIYLEPGGMNPRYAMMIWDSEFVQEKMYQALPIDLPGGNFRPADIKVARDGTSFLYAFYEFVDQTAGPKGTANLWASKFSLDLAFQRLDAATEPVASGPFWTLAETGDEFVNDPIVVIGPESIFAITRLKPASFSRDQPTRYRIRELNPDLSVRQPGYRDLDLTSAAPGGARQAQAIYYQGAYYLVLPASTRVGNYFEANVTPSDLMLVKLDTSWTVISAWNLTNSPDDVAMFSTGLAARQDYFFVTYKRGVLDGGSYSFDSPLNLYDSGHQLSCSEVVVSALNRESLRSSLHLSDSRAYVGHGVGPMGNERVVIYTYGVLGW